uniref:Uncharacterized protein n=1 Tax=Arundo donax TaxID=35708 RepID=A0A0A8Z5G7_ARUDO
MLVKLIKQQWNLFVNETQLGY